MIIVVGEWRKKVVKIVAAVIVVGLFAAAIPFVSGILYDKVPVFTGWFDDEHPSGNPLRVDNNTTGVADRTESVFNEQMDRFVVKVQNFYYEEKE
ncbi:MAG TPA: hypothetical protein P5549_08890 [Syntrophomonas sp.]|jgi:hypothetical protein|nr:hypothetical protein [Syntrophomonas sp.]